MSATNAEPTNRTLLCLEFMGIDVDFCRPLRGLD